jgi:beta-lactamase regulating signal transducer with metallopeptidase domain
VGPLLNWLVQGTVVVCLVAAGLRLSGWRRAEGRYRVWQLTLALVLLQPLASVAWQAGPADPSQVATVEVAHDESSAPLVPLPPAVWQATWLPASLAALWLVLHAMLLARDLRALRRLRQRCLPLGENIEARLPAATRARLVQAGVRLVASEDVRAAAALGARRPLIALQPHVVTQLSDAELHRTVLHEWAHVERGDLRATLVERMVKAAVGWHPAVACVLSKLRTERELACDERVVAEDGSGRDYAALLTRLAVLCARAQSAPGLAAHAVSSGLGRRVAHALTIDAAPRQPTARREIVCREIVCREIVRREIVRREIAVALGLVVITVGVSAVAVFGPRATTSLAQAVDVLVAPAASPAPWSEAASQRRAAAVSRSTSRSTSGATPVTMPVTTPVRTRQTTATPDAAIEVAPQATAVPQREDGVPDTVRVAEGEPLSDPASGTHIAAGEQPPAQDARPVFQGAPVPARELVTLSAALAGEATSAWSKAAEAGAAIGRQSQDSATSAARFFTRFGKRVASSVSSF